MVATDWAAPAVADIAKLFDPGVPVDAMDTCVSAKTVDVPFAVTLTRNVYAPEMVGMKLAVVVFALDKLTAGPDSCVH